MAQLLIEERRRYPRCPIQLPLLYRSRDPSSVAAGAGWTQNLCKGGALVELAEHLLPQTPLSLLLQTDEGSVGVEAQVVWTREHVAVGGVLHAEPAPVAPGRQRNHVPVARGDQRAATLR